MPRLWSDTVEEHRRGVREAVLKTTAALVTQHGLRSVTMSQIAEASGIGRATLYKYFPDVDAILRAWHEAQIDRHLEQLARLQEDTEPSKRVEVVLEAYAVICFESRRHRDTELAAFLHRDEGPTRAQAQLHALLRTLLRDAAQAGIVRDDVPAAELASFCIAALGAASTATSRQAARRLAAITLAALRQP